MDNTLDEKLSHAFELIEANRIDEARNILEPLTEVYPDNVDVWWMYAHAVDSPQEAQNALRNIIRIDPDYPGATELLAQTEAASRPAIKSIKPIAPLADPATDDDDLNDFDDDTEESSPANRGLLIGAAAIFGLIAVVVLAFSLLNNRGASPSTTPTQIANQATDVMTETPGLGAGTSPTEATEETPESAQPTETGAVGVGDDVEAATATVEPMTEMPSDTPEPTNTEEPSETPSPTDTDTSTPTDVPTATPVDVETVISLFQESLGSLAQPDSETAIDVQETPLGETLIYQVCLSRDEERADVLNAAFEAFETVASDLPAGDLPADAIAVTLFDCESETPLRTVGANLSDVVALANGTIDENGFRVGLTVID